MRKTNLKEIYIIRYADDFRIFCKNKRQADKARIAITNWLSERLKLEVSEEKTKTVNTKCKYMEFLGFKMKVYTRGNKWTIKSHVNDKRLAEISKQLKTQISRLSTVGNKYEATSVIRKYNAMVLGVHGYYHIATDICRDFRKIQYEINAIMNGRMHGTHKRRGKFSRTGRKLSTFEKGKYGKSEALRYYKGNGEPIYPIAYVTPKPPISKLKRVCKYTPEGREGIHDNLRVDMGILLDLMRTPVPDRSLEYNDNRISLYSAQWGRCAITQRVFKDISEIHCHHKLPREYGGSDKYENLTLILVDVHRLLHAKREETIMKYMEICSLTTFEVEKLNKMRAKAFLEPIQTKI